MISPAMFHHRAARDRVGVGCARRSGSPRWLRWALVGLAAGCGAADEPAETATTGAVASGSTTGAATTAPATTDTATPDTAATDTGATDTGVAPEWPTVPCSECFPLERLPDELRAEAETLLLLALDREALYTIAADVKPMSSGFAELAYPADEPAPPELDQLRAILTEFTCTPELAAGVQVFHATFDDLAYADGVVFHAPRMRATVKAFVDLFAAIGVAADDPLLAIVEAVDADPTVRRFRGYGHLFGYPEYAVDFFADAAEHEAMTGEFVERGFIHIPTFESDEGRFVYAVPVGHQENDDDAALRARAAPVLARYAELRASFVGDGKPGVLALVRTWFDDGAGQCSPRHALVQDSP